MTPPSLRGSAFDPGVGQATRFLNIAGPVCFLNSIKVLFVASLVQAVTAISPASSAANGVMTAIYFFAVMGDGVSQAAQTFLPPVLGSSAPPNSRHAPHRGGGSRSAQRRGQRGRRLAMPGLFTKSAEVVAIMAECAPAMSVALRCTASMGSEGVCSREGHAFMSFCSRQTRRSRIGRTAAWVRSGWGRRHCGWRWRSFTRAAGGERGEDVRAARAGVAAAKEAGG